MRCIQITKKLTQKWWVVAAATAAAKAIAPGGTKQMCDSVRDIKPERR